MECEFNQTGYKNSKTKHTHAHTRLEVTRYYTLLPDSTSFEPESIQVAASRSQGEEVGASNRKGPSLSPDLVSPRTVGFYFEGNSSPMCHVILILNYLLGCKYGFLPFKGEETYTLAELQNILFPEGFVLVLPAGVQL